MWIISRVSLCFVTANTFALSGENNDMTYKFDIKTEEFQPFGRYAKMFDVATSTVTYWADHYGLPFVQPGGVRFTSDEAFSQWLESRNGTLPERIQNV